MLFFKKKEKEMKFRGFDEEFNVYEFTFKKGYMIKTHAVSGVEVEKYKIEDILKIYNSIEFDTEKVNKSVVKRAIVGGIVAGGTGAVIGGLSGVGEKTKSTPIKVINIVLKKNGKVIIEKFRPELSRNCMKIEDINNKIQESNNR